MRSLAFKALPQSEVSHKWVRFKCRLHVWQVIPVWKREKHLCTGIIRGQWKNFEWIWRGKGIKPNSLRISLGTPHQYLRDGCWWGLLVCCHSGAGDLWNSKDTRVIDVLGIVEVSEKEYTGIRAIRHPKGFWEQQPSWNPPAKMHMGNKWGTGNHCATGKWS